MRGLQECKCVCEFTIQAIHRSYNVFFFHKFLLSNLVWGNKTELFLEGLCFKAVDFPFDLHFVVIQVGRWPCWGGPERGDVAASPRSRCDCFCLWRCLLMLPSDLQEKVMPARDEMRQSRVDAEMNVGQMLMERGVTPNCFLVSCWTLMRLFRYPYLDLFFKHML